MEIEIQIIQPGNIEDFYELIKVFEIVFEMESFKRPTPAHINNLIKQQNFFAVTAKTNDKIIAGLTLYILDQYYSEKPLAYIYDLAVLTEYQRKGVGRKLIEFVNEYCKVNGCKEVFVQADKADDYAIHFYRSTKPSNEEQVVHFTYKLFGDKLHSKNQ